jgi:hypothetical protein
MKMILVAVDDVPLSQVLDALAKLGKAIISYRKSVGEFH